jgi:hypothetical protein
VTYTLLVKAYGRGADKSRVRILERARDHAGLAMALPWYENVVKAYTALPPDLSLAVTAFEKLVAAGFQPPPHTVRDLLSAFSYEQRYSDALQLFMALRSEYGAVVVGDAGTWFFLIEAFAQCGNMRGARTVVEEMEAWRVGDATDATSNTVQAVAKNQTNTPKGSSSGSSR